MARMKVTLGKKNPKDFYIPDYDALMESSKGESIMFFSYHTFHNKKFRQFYGVGTVYRIARGEKYDFVYINFGIEPTHKLTMVSVIDNKARRQILTLKRGQICQVYGVSCKANNTYKKEDGTYAKRLVNVYYAKGLNGWYVPTMLDIKKLPKNEDLVETSDNEDEYVNNTEDILDLFIGDDD